MRATTILLTMREVPNYSLSVNQICTNYGQLFKRNEIANKLGEYNTQL